MQLSENLKTEGYAKIPLEYLNVVPLNEALIELTKKFEKFIQEVPKELKQRLFKLEEEGNPKSSIGYVDASDDKDSGRDNKEYLHVKESLYELCKELMTDDDFIQLIDSQQNREEIKQIINSVILSSMEIHKVLTLCFSKVLEILDEELGSEIRDQFFIEGKKPDVFMRLLYYKGNLVDGQNMARPHLDQSSFTFGVFETEKGLRLLKHRDGMTTKEVQNKLELVKHEDDQLLFFLGGRCNDFVDKSDFTPTVHDVVRLVERRISIAIFFHPPDGYKDGRQYLPPEEVRPWEFISE